MKNQFQMLKQLQQMQAKMAQVQAELEKATVEATAGGGVVKAVATGSQKLVSIVISPEVAGDLDMLPDLIVAAVNEALEKSRQLQAERMQGLTAGLGLPPGLL
ncbi:MAG: YbaB/EbfC family nucleoid-associated protein [Chloroflexi bacterium]|nr:MAG: YbaB/EbfC family nucleoid-associated protein [Chloroflexota bacterium]TME19347.1 MAG: YbaB/EbfC family nucleoid-associated protein [Chloroflexota bacterium]